jgi:hypothetical protein
MMIGLALAFTVGGSFLLGAAAMMAAVDKISPLWAAPIALLVMVPAFIARGCMVFFTD